MFSFYPLYSFFNLFSIFNEKNTEKLLKLKLLLFVKTYFSVMYFLGKPVREFIDFLSILKIQNESRYEKCLNANLTIHHRLNWADLRGIPLYLTYTGIHVRSNGQFSSLIPARFECFAFENFQNAQLDNQYSVFPILHTFQIQNLFR